MSFPSPCSTSRSRVYVTPTQEEPGTFRYLANEDTQRIGMVEKRIYSEAVKNLPICCVDVFLFDPTSRRYLLVLRKDPPAQGFWWPVGGRVYKGETLAECAKRKCCEELGLSLRDVTPLKNLGVAETFFPDSAWDSQTHTINTLYLAIVNAGVNLRLNETCQDYKWIPIDTVPTDEDPYVQNIYTLAMETIKISYAA